MRRADVDAEAVVALERAGRGESGALMWLYDRFGALLFGIALRITGSRAEAEEVVQDAMTRAWLEAPSFDRARGTALAWLVALARNRAIDVVRARGRRVVHETAARETRRFEEPGTPEVAVVDAERADAVRTALSALTEDQRAALDLSYFAGLSHSEIAQRLGQPLGTVKTRIAQSVRRLREVLAAFGPGSSPPSPPDATKG